MPEVKLHELFEFDKSKLEQKHQQQLHELGELSPLFETFERHVIQGLIRAYIQNKQNEELWLTQDICLLFTLKDEDLWPDDFACLKGKVVLMADKATYVCKTFSEAIHLACKHANESAFVNNTASI